MKQTMGDIELLREYALHGSDQAFATLVSRYINMVYSVALRHVRNPSQAEEISQAVFIVLAKKAASLGGRTVLSGWLFHTARLTAANYVRKEIRRLRKEQEAYMRSTLSEGGDVPWERIAPCLDAAIAELGEKDRNAIVLRYVEGKNLKEVGEALGASEDAAKMRVNRAVEKLRGVFKKQGIVLSSAALCGIIAAHAVEAAPAGLAGATALAVTQGTAVSVSTMAIAKGTLKLMAWTKVKIAGGVIVAGLVAFQWHEIIAQRRDLAAVQQELHERDNKLEKQKAELEKLHQERLVMAEDLRTATTAKAKAIGKEKAAVAAAKSASVAAAGKETSPMEMAKLLVDPSMNELLRVQTKALLKGQIGGFAKKMNLGEADMDKLYNLYIDKSLKDRASAAAVIRGEMDVDQALAKREQGKQQMESELRALLGDANYAQFGELKKDAIARKSLESLNSESSDNPLNETQRAQFLKVMHDMPELPTIDNIDVFRSKESLDQVYQGLEDTARKLREQSSAFLSAEQLAALEKTQTGVIQHIKSELELGQKVLVGQAK
ncbi:RNA polymerase sigma factor [Pedosphaera parvula]|uniref:RNA polymerase, sigma-24 subunit, ECF subfamily n=1 Tax=Pedosphaera parvula (strain Ellin514) TaxID=320771 RepID=B9XEY3_PEDPL|nr:sigma-70 family RNA polymerase sigma factor [Pedosphaera parvula]EEF61481.1 RNA polymerase, sigma-24 subunit, ECF subfamily [Pedosphaera parvula Ellin514]